MGWWSLKKELFTYFFITSTVILIFLGIILYSVMDRTIYERVQKDQKLFLENQLQLVDSNLSLLENLILKVSNDSNLQAMMQVPKSQADTFSESSSRFYMTLENYMQPIEKYISVLHIEGNNGLKVRKGFESYLIDKEDYEGTEWYRKSMDTTGAICWWEMQKNFTRIPHVWVAAPTEYIVPIYKKICRSDDMEILGDMVVFISPSLFFGEEYHPFSDSDTHSYLVDASGQIVYSDDEDFINRDSGTTMNLLDMEPIELERSNARQTRIQSMNGRLVVYRKSSASNLWLVRVIQLENVVRQESHFLYVTAALIIGLILLSFVLSLKFSNSFTRPIEEVIVKINHIAQGDFNYSHSIGPGGKKFELLYQNLYKMEQDIQSMMEENRRKEKEKRKLEISMLQMQINPHFLYNTLSSIKWMAVFQGARGIESMVNSLGIILEASYSRVDEFVRLKEELEILGHYFTIQKIRYQDKISLETSCGDQGLLQCYVPRFILQPIVENAIFHGIAPKEEPGEIRLTIDRDSRGIVISVWDNGVGMDQDILDRILKENEVGKRGRIGVSNVHSRITLIYGAEYGVEIESRRKHFTAVRLHIPEEYEERGHTDEGTGGR